MTFWDSSVIIALLVREPTTGRAMALLQEDPVMVAWWGTPVECVSALARLEREGGLPAAQVARAVERLGVLRKSWHEILPGDAVREVAERLLRSHPLRAADALQLAAATVAADHRPSGLPFVCSDARLAEAAGREGFPVLQVQQ